MKTTLIALAVGIGLLLVATEASAAKEKPTLQPVPTCKADGHDYSDGFQHPNGQECVCDTEGYSWK